MKRVNLYTPYHMISFTLVIQICYAGKSEILFFLEINMREEEKVRLLREIEENAQKRE